MYSIDIMEKGCEYLLKFVSLDGLKKYHTKVKELLNGKANTNHTHSNYLTGITKTMVTNALGYTPPSTNTWRGIQNNLTSNSTTDSLSAAQGKALKALVDGKATVETGTWTPVLSGPYGSNDPNFPRVSSAMYIKIGKLVIFECSLSRISDSTNVWYSIEGLPYASSSSTLAYTYGEGWVIGVNGTDTVCRLDPIGRGNTRVNAITGTPISAAGFYNVYGWYVTD